MPLALRPMLLAIALVRSLCTGLGRFTHTRWGSLPSIKSILLVRERNSAYRDLLAIGVEWCRRVEKTLWPNTLQAALATPEALQSRKGQSHVQRSLRNTTRAAARL